MEEDALVAPVGGQREGATVEARGIVVLDISLGMALLGQGRMIDEGIAHVGIDGISIARHLPRQGTRISSQPSALQDWATRASVSAGPWGVPAT